jgi:hypothetical protein
LMMLQRNLKCLRETYLRHPGECKPPQLRVP